MGRDQSDEALMVQYQGGDTRAFELLLGRHQRPVFNFILRSVRSQATAEELLQETFLRVVKGAAKYERQAKFTTWLYTIARNLCVDHSRRMKHRRAQSLDQPLGEEGATLLDRVADNQLGADRRALSSELGERLRAAIDELVDDQREVFLLREFQNLPFKEIAEIVGVPENTVKSRMRYALEKLRLALGDYADLAKALP